MKRKKKPPTPLRALLTELRQKAGYTQQGLAEALGVAITRVRDYEQGRTEPKWKYLFALADILGVDVNTFRRSL
jgi:transcriptional regulator with XRE-family HTH domain